MSTCMGGRGVVRKFVTGVSSVAIAFFGFFALADTASAATTIQLNLPQGTAFSILGYDCGGITEQVYATGFDPTSGYPTGDAYLQTICSAGGKGGHSVTISAWGGATWDFTGALISATKLSSAPTVDPTFSASDANGNEVYNASSNAYLVLAPGFVPQPRFTGLSPTFGVASGGTSVTISGTGFTGATAVDFGTVPATNFTINSDTSITAVTPLSAPGTIDVTVTSAGGTSVSSSSDQYTFYGQPSISSVSPNSGPAGGGYAITVTGTNFTGTTSVMFGDAAGGFSVVNDATLSVFVPPSDSGPGDSTDIRVTSPGGTSPNTPADQFTYTAPAQVGLSPTKGLPGKTVKASGAHFVSGETVTMTYLTGLAAPSPASVNICSGVATASGRFTCKGKIPGTATAGARGVHSVVATGSTGTSAGTTFDIT
jgi:hypothetical protein